MGSFDPLRVNQPVEIELPGDSFNHYRSRVELIFADKLVVAAPLKGGAIVPLLPGTVVKVTYTDNIAIYIFTTEVISQSTKGAPTVTLGQPFDIKRIQRRNFVRLDTRLTITLKKLDENLVPVGEPFTASTVDLSGGGLMFGTQTELKPGDVLEATIYLSPDETVFAMGRVVRFMENPRGAREKYSVGFEFTIIQETERDKIIRFIFNRQRELRKRGLL